MAEKAPFAPPRVLAWEVTRRCPLKCRHCRAAAADVAYGGELTTDECRRVIDSISRTMIIWTGGEPMSRPDIEELVAHATSRGLRSVMAPCGMLVTEERLAALKAAGVSALSFSLDGPDAATHDSFRGVAGAYDNVTRAMAAARRVGMPFQINTTVSKLNIGRLDELALRAKELGAAKLDLFFLGDPLSSELGYEAFHILSYFEHVKHVLDRDVCDIGAASRFHLNQSVIGESLDGLSDRCTAHVHLLRKVDLHQSCL